MRPQAKAKAKGASRASEPRKSAVKSKSAAKPGATGKAASRLIDERIRDVRGWRGETLARMRGLILEADPEMIEEGEVDGYTGLVSPRDRVHWGDVHQGGEAHVRPWG